MRFLVSDWLATPTIYQNLFKSFNFNKYIVFSAHGNANAIETDPAISHIGQNISSITVSPAPVNDLKPKLEGAELMIVLRRQLEFYFSR